MMMILHTPIWAYFIRLTAYFSLCFTELSVMVLLVWPKLGHTHSSVNHNGTCRKTFEVCCIRDCAKSVLMYMAFKMTALHGVASLYQGSATHGMPAEGGTLSVACRLSLKTQITPILRRKGDFRYMWCKKL